MAKKLRVGVLFGGRSGEHEVSLVSAASVLQALDPQKYEVVPIGITREGRWVLPRGLLSSGAAASGTKALTHRVLSRALSDGAAVILPAEPGDAALVPAGADASSGPLKLDVVFPVLHGTFGEDGTVQGVLEMAGIAYVGAGVLGSAVGMDKDVQKRLFKQVGIPTAPYLAVLRRDWESDPEAVGAAVRRTLGFPVFVKPANLGSSVGITRVRGASALPSALEHAFEFDRKAVVERAVRKPRELEVSVLGNDDPQASLPGEVIPARDFYDYRAKYLEDSTRFIVPAKLLPRQTRRVQQLAVAAFLATECEGMARVDFLLERPSGKIYVNELNTIPGFTAISMYPKLWEASGVGYAELLDRLIELAVERHREKARRRFSVDLPTQRGGVLKE
jgi:D-alanine-D-alanine ligase